MFSALLLNDTFENFDEKSALIVRRSAHFSAQLLLWGNAELYRQKEAVFHISEKYKAQILTNTGGMPSRYYAFLMLSPEKLEKKPA